MHSLTRIRATAYSIMLVFAGVLAMPLPAYAQGDAADGEKIFAHCAPCHSAVHVRCWHCGDRRLSRWIVGSLG